MAEQRFIASQVKRSVIISNKLYIQDASQVAERLKFGLSTSKKNCFICFDESPLKI